MATDVTVYWVCPDEGCSHPGHWATGSTRDQLQPPDHAMWCDGGHEIKRLVPTVDRDNLEALGQLLLDVKSGWEYAFAHEGHSDAGERPGFVAVREEAAWLQRLIIEAQVV